MTATQQLQLKYWTAFREFLAGADSRLRGTKPPAQNWYRFSVGKSYFSLDVIANTRDKRIGVGLILEGPRAKTHFQLLEQQKEAIESELGESLEWRNRPENKTCQIWLFRRNTDPLIESDWSTQHEWLADKLGKMHRVFHDRVKGIDAGAAPSEALDDWVRRKADYCATQGRSC